MTAQKHEKTGRSNWNNRSDPRPPPPGSGARDAAVVGLFALGIFYTLHFAQAIILPLLVSLLLGLILNPVVRFLADRGVPKSIGAFLTIAALLTITVAGMVKLSEPASGWLSNTPDRIRKFEVKIRTLLEPAFLIGQAAKSVEELTDVSNSARSETENPPTSASPPPYAPGRNLDFAESSQTEPADAPKAESAPAVEIRGSTWTDALLSYTQSALVGMFIVVVMLYFLLASGDWLLLKLVEIMPSLTDKKRAIEMANAVQRNVSRYLFTISTINALLGFSVGATLYFYGMPNYFLWGVMACFLNFIPYLGAMIGTVILSLAAFLNYDAVGPALLVPFSYLCLTVMEGYFITPMILGRRFTINPLLILISLIFWTWMWGFLGALLSVPILVAVKIVCEHFENLHVFGKLLD